MDNKKINAPTTTVTRDLMDLCEDTGNIYETVAIIGKRANQISIETKKELTETLERFASSFEDNLEEVSENSTQNSVSIHYEKQPKPTLIATQEYIEGKIYHRRADKEKGKKDSEEQFYNKQILNIAEQTDKAWLYYYVVDQKRITSSYLSTLKIDCNKSSNKNN